MRRQLATLSHAATNAHAAYRRRSDNIPSPDHLTSQLIPGKLAMITRPKHNKILTPNAGPFIVIRVDPPHVFLQSLTHSLTLKENTKNVVPLHLDLPTSPTPPDYT